ncbi:MAG: flagellar biosynthesis protein FliQ [Pseudomonadota bacterium]
MTPESVVALWREAMFLIVVMVTVIVMPSLVVGLVVSTFQAATQINEQTLSFLPRLLTTLFAVLLAGPWLLRKVLDFTAHVITSIPFLLG